MRKPLKILVWGCLAIAGVTAFAYALDDLWAGYPGTVRGADEGGSCLRRNAPLESSRVLARHPDHADVRRRAHAAFRLRALLVPPAAHAPAYRQSINVI